MKLHTSLLVLCLTLACSFQVANAQYGNGYRYGGWGPFQSHEGFYLSTGLGIGGLNYKDNTQGISLSGPSGNFDLKLGGAVVPNFILSADFITFDTRNPDVVLNGVDQGRDYDYLYVDIFGIGATYYFMPVNIYLSGTVGTGDFDLDGSYSDNGLAVQLKAGKDWWVSRNWGIGVALVYTDLSAHWTNSETANASTVGLMFNASFN